MNDTGNDPGVTSVIGHSRFFIGVDLAQAQDFAAIVALLDEQLPTDQDGQIILGPRSLTISYADRFKGVLYPAICEHLAKLMTAKPFAGRCKLTIDGSGLGRPVSDLLSDCGVQHEALTMTVGQNWSRKGKYVSVGKTLLVENVSVLFSNGELAFAKDLQLRREIEQDLASFSLTETAAGNQIITQSRQSGSHGDLAIAMACAAFSATYLQTKTVTAGKIRGWY